MLICGSVDKGKCVCGYSPSLLSFVSRLVLPRGLCYSRISRRLLEEGSVNRFIVSVRSGFYNDLFSISRFPRGPVITIPSIGVNRSVRNISGSIFKKGILHGLASIFVYLAKGYGGGYPSYGLVCGRVY